MKHQIVAICYMEPIFLPAVWSKIQLFITNMLPFTSGLSKAKSLQTPPPPPLFQ